MRTHAQSEQAAVALELVSSLQARFRERMESFGVPFQETEWLRDDGRHGGGNRYGTSGTQAFDRASLNVSQVHYDDDPNKRLSSASALSCIVHPKNPRAPSMHMHISWTEMRDGHAYWRVMADLNPAIENDVDRATFVAALQAAAPDQFEAASAQGNRYFFIPALDRHRGVSHFYLEGYRTNEPGADRALARRFGTNTIDTYASILVEAAQRPSSAADQRAQLDYHTLYLFQVLTLDRGTTSGLLVHDQNDVGILGSLPSRCDVDLLASWRPRMPAPQELLLDGLTGVLGDGVVDVTESEKLALAAVVRKHYQAHPEALSLQASGDLTPPTVQNHR